MSTVIDEPTVFDWMHVLRELDKRLATEHNAKTELDQAFYNTDFSSIRDDIKEYISASIRHHRTEGFYLGMKYALDMLVSHNFTNGRRIEPDKNNAHHLIALGNYEEES